MGPEQFACLKANFSTDYPPAIRFLALHLEIRRNVGLFGARNGPNTGDLKERVCP